MQPTTAHDTVGRLRAWPGIPSGPAALLAVLAIVIVALATGLVVVLFNGPSAGAMP